MAFTAATGDDKVWISGKLADSDIEAAWDGAFPAGAGAKKGAKV